MAKLAFPALTATLHEFYKTHPVDFIESQCSLKNALDGGRSWIRPTLYPLQRQVTNEALLTNDPETGNPLYTTVLLSWARKMSKTILAAMWMAWRAVCFRNEIILLAGPTKNAATELAFTSIQEVFLKNEALKIAVGARMKHGVIRIDATESEIRAVSRTYGAQAGTDWSAVLVDELWSFTSKELQDYYDTITTPSPARISPMLVVTSYAPIKDKSRLLENLIRRANKKEPGLYASIVSGAKDVTDACPWISMKFLKRMKDTKPPHVFKRVFLNKMTRDSGEADHYAYSRKQVQSVIDPIWSRQEKRPDGALGMIIVSADFGAKYDAAAVSALCRMKNPPEWANAKAEGEQDRRAQTHIALLDMVAKHGTKQNPLPGDWVVEVVEEFMGRFGRFKVVIDPHEMTDEIVILRNMGLEVVEISHKGPLVGVALWKAISLRRLRLYPTAGQVEIFDGRQYSLTDELHNLQFDPETLKIGHIGEGTDSGRHYDDRCTTLGMALQTDELRLVGTTAIASGVQEMRQANAQLAGTGQKRIFDGRPIRPGASFAPRLIGPPGSLFGFTRHRR